MEAMRILDGAAIEKRFKGTADIRDLCMRVSGKIRKDIKNVDHPKEKRRRDTGLEAFAKEHGVTVVDLPEDPDARQRFIEANWTEDRKFAIKRVRVILRNQDTIRREFLRILEKGKQYYIRNRKGFLGAIKRAKSELFELEYKELIKTEIAAIETLLETIKDEGCAVENRKKMEDLWDVLFVHFRYQLEAMENTYCSMGLSPDQKQKLLRLKGKRDLYYVGERPKKHVDFGCGDGGSLEQLADDFHAQFALPETIIDAGLRAGRSVKGGNAIRAAIAKCLKTPRPAYDHFKGIEYSQRQVDALRRKGIYAKKGDICAPFAELKRRRVIQEGEANIVETHFTLDRVEDVNALLQNMAKTLKPGGRFIITTKREIDPKSDGAGKAHQVKYSQRKDLKAKNPAETLEKLFKCLEQHGFKPTTIAEIETVIISSDSTNRPQSFKALAVSGIKQRS